MHSLANLVVCTNLNFLLPKDEEKKMKKVCFFLSKITFGPDIQERKNAANVPIGLSRGNFGQGLPPVQVIFKIFAAIGRDRKGPFGLYKVKRHFFGKNLFKFYKIPICALTIEWATKLCSISDAVKPLVDLDN